MKIQKGIRAQVLPSQVYQAARHDSEVIEIPVGTDKHVVSVSRESWPDTGASVIEVSALCSFDGGLTWMFAGGFTAHGGESPPHFRTGLPQAESFMAIPLPDLDNPLRRLKVSIRPAVPLRTRLTVEAREKVAR